MTLWKIFNDFSRIYFFSDLKFAYICYSFWHFYKTKLSYSHSFFSRFILFAKISTMNFYLYYGIGFFPILLNRFMFRFQSVPARRILSSKLTLFHFIIHWLPPDLISHWGRGIILSIPISVCVYHTQQFYPTTHWSYNHSFICTKICEYHTLSDINFII